MAISEEDFLALGPGQEIIIGGETWEVLGSKENKIPPFLNTEKVLSPDGGRTHYSFWWVPREGMVDENGRVVHPEISSE